MYTPLVSHNTFRAFLKLCFVICFNWSDLAIYYKLFLSEDYMFINWRSSSTVISVHINW